VRAGTAGRVDCTFPSFPLAASQFGPYVLGVLVYDPRNGTSVVQADNFAELLVEERHVAGRRYPLTTGCCYVDAEHRWSVEEFGPVRREPLSRVRSMRTRDSGSPLRSSSHASDERHSARVAA